MGSRSGLRARHVAERHEIEMRYREWEIIGEPEYRRPMGAAFSPWNCHECLLTATTRDKVSRSKAVYQSECIVQIRNANFIK